jgi:hypothetical protein
MPAGGYVGLEGTCDGSAGSDNLIGALDPGTPPERGAELGEQLLRYGRLDNEAIANVVSFLEKASESGDLCRYGGVDVRQVMLAFFGQVLCVPDPVARFASAGRFVMPQLAMQALDELDAFAERSAERFCALIIKISKILQTVFPTAAFVRVTMVAAFAGCLEQILVFEIAALDELADENLGESERFYEFLSHWLLLVSIP